jgi:hypothetical protein
MSSRVSGVSVTSADERALVEAEPLLIENGVVVQRWLITITGRKVTHWIGRTLVILEFARSQVIHARKFVLAMRRVRRFEGVRRECGWHARASRLSTKKALFAQQTIARSRQVALNLDVQPW